VAAKRKSSKARKAALQRTKSRTSSGSQGLVLHVVKKDQKCDWLADFVQQFGEKSFGVDRDADLTDQQRVGWIRFNYAVARVGRLMAEGDADFHSLLGFLERIGSDEGSAELAEVEAEVKKEIAALAKSRSSEDGSAVSSDAVLAEMLQERKEERMRLNAVHDQKIRDWELRRKVQLAWDCIVLGATASCLVLAVMIILGVVGDEARMIGGTAVTGGIAIIGLLQVIIWGKWNPPPPAQFRE
jgi:hypothetical protein